MICEFPTWEEAFSRASGAGIQLAGEDYRAYQDEIDKVARAHGFTRLDDIAADEVLFAQIH